MFASSLFMQTILFLSVSISNSLSAYMSISALKKFPWQNFHLLSFYFFFLTHAFFSSKQFLFVCFFVLLARKKSHQVWETISQQLLSAMRWMKHLKATDYSNLTWKLLKKKNPNVNELYKQFTFNLRIMIGAHL